MSESTVDDQPTLLLPDAEAEMGASANQGSERSEEPEREPAAGTTSGARRLRLRRPLLPWYELACLTLATGLSAGLVFYNLGRRSLWIDEATTWGTASQHGSSLWYWLLHDGGNMLGYYALMHLLIPVIGSSPFALRFPGALCVVLTVPCGYFLLRKLFDWQAAVAGAFFLAASSPIVFWGQQARGYTPAILFTTAAGWALAVAVLDRKLSGWIAFVVTATIAAYMILLAALAILSLLTALLLVRRSELEMRRVLISVGTLLALWTPLAVAAIRRGSGQLDWIQPVTLNGPNSYRSNGMEIVSSQSNHLVAILTGAACLLGVAILIFRLAQNGRSALTAFPPALLVAWVVVPLVTLTVITVAMTPVISDRYIIPEVPAASLLAAASITRIGWRRIPIGLGLAGALVVPRTMQVVQTYGSVIEDWVGAVHYVASNYKAGDCLGFWVSDGFTAFDYYYLALPKTKPGAQLPDPIIPATTWDTKSPFVLDPETIPAAELSRVEATCKRLWIVYTHNSVEAPGPGVPKYFAYKFEVYTRFVRQLVEVHFVVEKTFPLVAVSVELYVRQPR